MTKLTRQDFEQEAVAEATIPGRGKCRIGTFMRVLGTREFRVTAARNANGTWSYSYLIANRLYTPGAFGMRLRDAQ